jgi:hypothetical protein
LGNARRAQRLEPLHLGLDVVRLDVDVHAARMLDLLHEHFDLALGHLQRR